MKLIHKLKTIDIVYPDTLRKALPTDLAICEGFITRLIQVKSCVIRIKINTNLKLVECNENIIKSYLDLILKAQKLHEFYNQFIALLHKNSECSPKSGKLECYTSGMAINFVVAEGKTIPDFEWEVHRNTQELN